MSITKIFFVFGVLILHCIAIVYGQCISGDVRLVDGSVSSEGRVEICINNEWGTVCDDFWGDNDAEVVCRQTGNSGGSATALSSARFGQGTGPIWLDDVFCTGSESELLDCSHDGIGVHNCDHSEDASVRCEDSLSTVEAIASGVIAAIVVGPLCFICTAIIICIAIGCCVSKQRTRTVQTVTQPSVTTVASTTTTTTQHAPPQQYPSGYSGYPPPGTQNPPEYMYPDYPPQTNPAYPYPVQLQPYPTNDPYSKPQGQLQVQGQAS